jgi:hypothetical protein
LQPPRIFPQFKDEEMEKEEQLEKVKEMQIVGAAEFKEQLPTHVLLIG